MMAAIARFIGYLQAARECKGMWQEILAGAEKNARTLRSAVAAIVCVAGVGTGFAAVAPDAGSATTLRAKYGELEERLQHNNFDRALYLDSIESPRDVRGDVYALVDRPFAAVNAAFNGPANWCDVLILPINTKYCFASMKQSATTLLVGIGKKFDEPVDNAYRIEFAYRVAVATPGYLKIHLDADSGPLGTSDYRIVLEAVPVQGGRTFLHLLYSYAYGLVGRVAMQTYLATAGRNKVGFTVVGMRDGQPEYIRGVRGAMERNTMRYYLAIDAYLGALATSRTEQLDKRLQDWFSASEQYPRQLHELDRAAYLDLKRKEYLRQQVPPESALNS